MLNIMLDLSGKYPIIILKYLIRYNMIISIWSLAILAFSAKAQVTNFDENPV